MKKNKNHKKSKRNYKPLNKRSAEYRLTLSLVFQHHDIHQAMKGVNNINISVQQELQRVKN